MPIVACEVNGKPGFKVGTRGSCYQYTPGDEQSKKDAHTRAVKQWYAFAPEEVKEWSKSKAAEQDLPEFKEICEWYNGLSPQKQSTLYHEESLKAYFDNEWEKACAYITVEERDKISSDDFALPPKGFPITNQSHLNAAVKLMGRESPANQAIIHRNIVRLAHKHGLTLPASWSGSHKE